MEGGLGFALVESIYIMSHRSDEFHGKPHLAPHFLGQIF